MRSKLEIVLTGAQTLSRAVCYLLLSGQSRWSELDIASRFAPDPRRRRLTKYIVSYVEQVRGSEQIKITVR